MAKSDVTKLTHDQEISNLRVEYDANIQLWIYEATFREQRSQMFLTINTILLTALGILVTFNRSYLQTAIIAIPITSFALPACILWYLITRPPAATKR